MNRFAMVFLLSGAVVALLHVPLRAGGQRGTAAPAWRTSWVALVEAVNGYKKANKEFLEATFQMMLKGQRVPEKWAVMKEFSGRVTFEGTFGGVTTEDLMDGMTAKLNFVMPKSPVSGFVVHIYPSAASIPAWKAMPTGEAARFRAVITGVAGVEAIPGRFGPVTLLENAEPTK
jgi:hypothetical protein